MTCTEKHRNWLMHNVINAHQNAIAQSKIIQRTNNMRAIKRVKANKYDGNKKSIVKHIKKLQENNGAVKWNCDKTRHKHDMNDMNKNFLEAIISCDPYDGDCTVIVKAYR